jgi:O-antigen/teichoic acid export membrane protein
MKKLLSIFLIIACLVSSSPARAQGTMNIYYAGTDGAVKQALTVAGFTFVDDPSQAAAIILNGAIPETLQVREGQGLLLVMSEAINASAFESLTGIPVSLSARDDPISLQGIAIDDPITREIVWNSAPQIRERYELLTPISSVQPLVTAYEGGAWFLWQARSNIFVINAFLDERNPQIQEWSYFNYLIYHLAARAAGKETLTFADYPGSPVPHDEEQNLLIALMGALIVTTFAAFYVVRRWSMRHPEALDHIVADHKVFESAEKETAWEDVGFHRPLSGFLVALSTGLLFFIPLIIYQNLILPTYILPSAQALGIWGRVTQFFNLAWMFFDMGTSIAFIKYLSQYRVSDPKRGVMYGQVFVWWQALSGAVQVAIVIGLAATFAPSSAYAIYAWSVIVHAMIQLPGFYQVFRNALNGFQRQDYARYLDIGLQVIMPMIVQPIFVGIMYAWGKDHPLFGGALGGLFGLGMAAYAAELLTFVWGWWMYKRSGYNAGVLFMAHFDWDVIKTSFKFGVFEMIGSAAWSFGQAAEIAITQARLINYAEIWGNWGMAQNFIFAFNVAQTLNDGVMPAISEAISSGKRILSQYYSVMAYKYNGLVSAFLGAVLLAVAPRFIIGASGIEFQRAALYVVPLTIWGAIQFPSWVGDNVQLGANKPYIKSILVFLEQVVRVILAWILLDQFQVNALIIAYFVGLLAKGASAYFINHRACYPQKFYFWQSLIAPLLAGAAHFALVNWISGMIWQGDEITSILIFFIGILPSFPIYMLLYGFFGGWDNATLAELKQAMELTGTVKPLAWIVYQSTALGARVSPLTNRFPITIRSNAMEEAKALTIEKVKL